MLSTENNNKDMMKMIDMTKKKRVVVKVGTSTLTHSTGLLNIRRVEQLVKTLADVQNAGHEIILVSSGAVGLGERCTYEKYCFKAWHKGKTQGHSHKTGLCGGGSV